MYVSSVVLVLVVFSTVYYCDAHSQYIQRIKRDKPTPLDSATKSENENKVDSSSEEFDKNVRVKKSPANQKLTLQDLDDEVYEHGKHEEHFTKMEERLPQATLNGIDDIESEINEEGKEGDRVRRQQSLMKNPYQNTMLIMGQPTNNQGQKWDEMPANVNAKTISVIRPLTNMLQPNKENLSGGVKSGFSSTLSIHPGSMPSAAYMYSPSMYGSAAYGSSSFPSSQQTAVVKDQRLIGELPQTAIHGSAIHTSAIHTSAIPQQLVDFIHIPAQQYIAPQQSNVYAQPISAQSTELIHSPEHPLPQQVAPASAQTQSNEQHLIHVIHAPAPQSYFLPAPQAYIAPQQYYLPPICNCYTPQFQGRVPVNSENSPFLQSPFLFSSPRFAMQPARAAENNMQNNHDDLSECSIASLSSFNPDLSVVEGLVNLEDKKMKKIQECAKQNKLNSMEYEALVNLVRKEISILQSEVKTMQDMQHHQSQVQQPKTRGRM